MSKQPSGDRLDIVSAISAYIDFEVFMIFYIIENNTKEIPDHYTLHNIIDYKNTNSLKEQAKDLGLDIEIQNGTVTKAPKSISKNYICFLNKNQLISENYLKNIVNILNLDRNTSVLCGPVYYNHQRLINYDLNRYGNATIMDITGEIHNYPSLNNVVFSGVLYNKFSGYSPTATPRGFCTNYSKIANFATMGKILYSDYLLTNSLYPEDYDLFKYYYSIGYECKTFNKNSSEYEAFLASSKFHSERAGFMLGMIEAETQAVVI